MLVEFEPDLEVEIEIWRAERSLAMESIAHRATTIPIIILRVFVLRFFIVSFVLKQLPAGDQTCLSTVFVVLSSR